MFRIELLPAGIGDAIWIEYGDPVSPRRIVIDGRPAPSYQKGLLARLERLKKADPKAIIDLFVITHIDADHIDGAIILLQHADKMGVRFGEIWFNAWPQLAPIGPATYAPQQGEVLAALIDRPGLKDKWNTRTKGAAIVLSDTGPLLEHPLPDEARLTPISPDSQPSPMGLEIADAVSAARRILIRRALSPDPCSLQSVSAITGLSLRITEDTLTAMIAGEDPEVRLLTRGRLERYELTGAA